MGRNCFSCGTGAPCCVCPTTARRRTFSFHFSLSLAVANIFHMCMHQKSLNLNHTVLLVRGLCIAVGFFPKHVFSILDIINLIMKLY